MRIIRTSDNSILGTFSQTLNCSTTSGSSSSTPNIDEDCNGSWDNTSIKYCTNSGCQSGYTCAQICNNYGNLSSCQNSGSYCYQQDGSNVKAYSWYHNYTNPYSLTPGVIYGPGCGTANCYTKLTLTPGNANCTYNAACGETYN
ncbi:MAG: hypothetical protein AB7E37_04710 [Candidatus Altimarinota bacterium]